jgi:ABC-type sugar transport system permease subunit
VLALVPAYRELNVLFMQQQPTLPLVYRPDAFYEFSEKHWSNMATAENPYLPPLVPGDRLGTKMLWTIKPSLVYVAILIAEIWQWTPFMFLLLLAALSGVDKSQLEAASIDGAGYWRTFRKIVLPAIWPVMVVAILIRGLDLFRLFDVVWALTKGGPGTMTETLSVFTYVKGFQQFETSYTAAVALLRDAVIAVFWALKRVELART